MDLMDLAMRAAGSQSDKIARVLGKNPSEVKSAINQARKLLPKVLENPKELSKMGIDREFINDMYSKYSPYASKIPGLNKAVINNALNMIDGALESPKGPDMSRYPKI